MALLVKNPPANAGDTSSVPVLERFPGGGHGHPLQYSCLENPTDRRAWRAAVHRVAKSWMWLCDWTHTHSVQWYKFLSKHCVHSVPQILISCIFIFFWFILSFFSEIRSLIHVLFGSVLFNLQVLGIFQLFFCYWSIVLIQLWSESIYYMIVYSFTFMKLYVCLGKCSMWYWKE